ncbi:MAG: sigma 54-interacting transcriptional regulator [Polyangiaceae bacterium]
MLSDGHDWTDVQERFELPLQAERARPILMWTDARGSQSAELTGRDQYILGSSEHAHLAIADRAVSRVHAELEVRPDGVWIRDLGSRNGTWVESVLVQHARVPEAGSVRVGSTLLRLGFDANRTRVSLWPSAAFGPLVGQSERMRELFLRLSQYAPSEAAVLILGETGSGKELVARALHERSNRADGPFLVVDCGALPETLLESELFGHTRGAFTGAVATRLGVFEAARGGTVFLDEIGELPLGMQPKLLRALESKTVRRLGESESRSIDVRFLAATHRDLHTMVSTGAFREDLFFRLSVLPVRVPALRERPDDIPILLAHFLDPNAGALPPWLLDELRSHPWLGNVRELRSLAERISALGAESAWALTRGVEGAEALAPSELPRAVTTHTAGFPPVNADAPFKALREEWNDHLEREYLSQLLARHGRDIATISRAAGLDRSYVHRLLRKHDL